MHRPKGLSRREFLKLISLAPVGMYARPLSRLAAMTQAAAPNIIILVFDAWSYRHVSLHGYPRLTMPNLERFAAQATLYHNHFSTGSFTVPSTSTIFTGLHPWSHRAFQIGAGLAQAQVGRTMFSALSGTHASLAYTQNKLADQILYQVEADLDRHVDTWRFNRQNNNPYSLPVFRKDIRMAFAGLEDNVVQQGVGFDSSVFFGPLYRLHKLWNQQQVRARYGAGYPRGMPASPGIYLLEDVVDGAIGLLRETEQPTLAYFHFLPPHEPYAPKREFFESFEDGWNPPDKPVHALSEKKTRAEKLHLHRRLYDEFIASWDHEVTRLFEFLRQSGMMENSYIFVMADHGELFERGELGHVTRLLYDPVVHVPLMVSSPGQRRRQDIHSYTSHVDLLPTLAHLTGNPIPAWSEGQLLPGLGGVEDDHRSLFAMDAKTNSSFGPLQHYSMSLTRDHHRLVYYCYPREGYQTFEFYDLDADPEEVQDLFASRPALAREMQDELLQKVADVNRPFERNNT